MKTLDLETLHDVTGGVGPFVPPFARAGTPAFVRQQTRMYFNPAYAKSYRDWLQVSRGAPIRGAY
jgi:hypothetical protein